MNDSPLQAERPKSVTRIPRWLRVALSLLLAACVGLAAFAGFARASFVVGPARVSVALAPAYPGSTTAQIPPFGSISAATHRAPIALDISLEEVDLPRLEALVDNGVPEDAVLDGFVDDVRQGMRLATMKGLFAALLAGGFAGWALRHRWRVVLSSAVVGVLLPGLLVGWANLGFDAGAFRNPEFRGAVSYAPAIISLVQHRVTDVEGLRDQITRVARDLTEYYRTPQNFASGGSLEGTYRVLHVSDLHLDPVGLQLAEDLAAEFEVSLVIDTGDISHYGSDIEASLVRSAVPTDVPRVYVAGNHDSPAIVAEMANIDGVTVLDGRTVEIDGLRILGIADPKAQTVDVEPDRQVAEELAQTYADELERDIASGEPTPTIVAVHDPVMEGAFEGLVPLVLSGHTHSPRLFERGGTWFLNSSTTGGVHFSDLRSDPHIPHSASVLYYTQTTPRRLIAIDRIEVFGIGGGQSSLSRTIVDTSLLPQ